MCRVTMGGVTKCVMYIVTMGGVTRCVVLRWME